MPAMKEGDRVRIPPRTATEDDSKSGMYYSHYGGLTGTIQKVYSEREVAIEVDHESLTKDIRKRHEDVRDQMKTKWIEGLSEEGRSKLTEREKDFNLRYVVLAAMSDLEKAGARAPAKESAPRTAESLPAAKESESAPRKTLAELEAAEEAELLRRAQPES